MRDIPLFYFFNTNFRIFVIGKIFPRPFRLNVPARQTWRPPQYCVRRSATAAVDFRGVKTGRRAVRRAVRPRGWSRGINLGREKILPDNKSSDRRRAHGGGGDPYPRVSDPVINCCVFIIKTVQRARGGGGGFPLAWRGRPSVASARGVGVPTSKCT